MRKILIGLTAASILTSAGNATAEDVIEASEPLVVTATRTPRSPGDLTSAVIVIDRERIELTQAYDLATLLDRLPGFEVARNGGPGQNAGLFVRGTDSNHTLVMIDGVRINPGTLGGAPIADIDLDQVERIEIVKGPRSSLYGTEALGAVVNIITRGATGAEGLSYRVGTRAGSDATRELDVGLSGRHSKLDWSVSAGSAETDGFPTVVGTTLDRGYERRSLDAQLGWAVADWRLEVGHWNNRGVTEYLDFFLTPVDQDFSERSSRLSAEGPLSDRWTTRVVYAHTVYDIDQNQSVDFVATARDTIDWQNTFTVSDQHQLLAGVYLMREDTRSLSFGTAFDESTDVTAVYLEDLYSIDDRQDLLAALRFTDHDTAGSELTWNLEYGRDLGARTRFRASAGTAFRAPDATDRFGFGGDPDLEPETSRSLELGITHGFGETGRFEVALFDTRIQDLIEFDLSTFTIANIEEAHILGLELGASGVVGGWDLSGSLVVQNPENETTGQQLARRAPRYLDLAAHRRFGDLTVGGELRLAAARLDSPFAATINGGYGVLDLYARYRIAPAWDLGLRIENAGDRAYATAAGFNSQDRAFFLSLDWRGSTVDDGR